MAKTRSKKPKVAKARSGKAKGTAKAAAPMRADSKQAQLIAMLRAPAGATIAKIVKTFGWQPHTVRGVFSGALKKELGLTITSEKAEGGERVYRIA
jgi:Protein of unknown function (DUF3489)